MLTIRELKDGSYAIILEYDSESMHFAFSGIFSRISEISGNEEIRDCGLNITVNLKNDQ